MAGLAVALTKEAVKEDALASIKHQVGLDTSALRDVTMLFVDSVQSTLINCK